MINQLLDLWLWVSVAKFHEYTGQPVVDILAKCECGIYYAKLIEGMRGPEYRLNAACLPQSLLLQYLTDLQRGKFSGGLSAEEIRREHNVHQYLLMSPRQKKDVDKWLPIMIETPKMVGRELNNYCKSKSISYTNILHYRKKWIKSRGDICALVCGYEKAWTKRKRKKAVEVFNALSVDSRDSITVGGNYAADHL